LSRIRTAPRLILAVVSLVVAALAVGSVGVAGKPNKTNKSKPAEGLKVSRGATTLTVAPAFAAALSAEVTSFDVLEPAEGTPPAIAFPITNGRVVLAKSGNTITGAAGKISHVGGLQFSDAANTFRSRNFRIVLDADPNLSALVKMNEGAVSREELFDLTVDPAKIFIDNVGKNKRRLRIEDIVVKLEGVCAAALNAAFSPATPFTDGQLVGTADVNTRIVGKKG